MVVDFKIMPMKEKPAQSPFDIKSINTNISKEEIIDALRESRIASKSVSADVEQGYSDYLKGNVKAHSEVKKRYEKHSK